MTKGTSDVFQNFKMNIIPAIMPKSFEDMRQKMAQVIEYVPVVQLDIMDGVFVPERTFPFFKEDEFYIDKILRQEESLPYWDRLDVELDLMVKDAHKDFDKYVAFGPKRIIFHIEAEGEYDLFNNFLEAIDPYLKETIEFGVAISNNTPIEDVYSFVPNVDFVQLMGIENIGYQGEEFDERVIDRIKNLREKFPDLKISIDGSVNKDTILALKEAGADRFVVGSAIFNSMYPKQEIDSLSEVAE